MRHQWQVGDYVEGEVGIVRIRDIKTILRKLDREARAHEIRALMELHKARLKRTESIDFATEQFYSTQKIAKGKQP